jgi:Protein of unknown function (DUF3179)
MHSVLDETATVELAGCGNTLRCSAMRALFFAALAALVGFEALAAYLVMPMPYSQRLETLALAYALFRARWFVRVGLAALTLVSGLAAWRAGKVSALGALLVAASVTWFINARLSADAKYHEPSVMTFAPRASNQVDESSLVLGVEHQGAFKAYPVRFLLYHHQVRDTVNGLPVLVTYCSACRLGRVFEPVVDGRPATFRLVGMDLFNALFEDAATGSWWRQATGEAVAGPLRGARLKDVTFMQVQLKTWFALHPEATVLQLDESARPFVDLDGAFERGEVTSRLLRPDPASWQNKSLVVGLERGAESKAYDWNALTSTRIVNDTLGAQPVVLVLSSDHQSFAAYERPTAEPFTLSGDLLVGAAGTYDLAGRDRADPARRLRPVAASQEFWHSWRTFHPTTQRSEAATGE